MPSDPKSTVITNIPTHEAQSTFPAPENVVFKSCGNAAVDTDHPNGTTKHNWAEQNRHRSVVEQHVLFFDRDHDGVITPLDTFHGFRALGFNLLYSMAAMLFIHLGLSYWTQQGLLPDPLFRIYTARMHRAKHGSDSGVYDPEGRFNPQAFEALFTKYDKGSKGGLTFAEGRQMVYQHRNTLDLFGWTAATLEWGTTWLMFSPSNGMVTKEQIRTMYDGSVFYTVAQKVEAEKKLKYEQKQQKRGIATKAE